MIGGITSMIEGGVSMEGSILMLEDITSMMDHITMMIEGLTSMIEDTCTLKLWIEEGFLHILDQIPRIRTILTVGDPRTIHQVHGDRSILLAPDIQWSLRFPMKEVGGGMEDTIMIDSIDDLPEALCISLLKPC